MLIKLAQLPKKYKNTWENKQKKWWYWPWR